MNIKDRLKKTSADAKEKRTQILMGLFNAVVESFKPKVYKTGSFGFEVTYAITDAGEGIKGRKIWENIVVKNKDGEFVKFGDERLLRRLNSLGVTDEQLSNFEIPENTDEKGSLATLHGTKVILELARDMDEETGAAYQKLKKVTQPKAKAA